MIISKNRLILAKGGGGVGVKQTEVGRRDSTWSDRILSKKVNQRKRVRWIIIIHKENGGIYDHRSRYGILQNPMDRI